MMQIKAESRIVTSKFKYTKNNIKSHESVENDRPIKCSELPSPVLNDILGAAFNSRYVSDKLVVI